MKKQFLMLLTIFVFLSCNEQKDLKTPIKQKEESVYISPPRKIDENSLIGFACYSSGRKSKPVTEINKLLLSKDYSGIREKLYSKSVAERYLATVVCQRLEQKKTLSLTQTDQHQIEKNKNSDEKITICSGCTNEEEMRMKALFSSETFLSDYLKDWLNEMLK